MKSLNRTLSLVLVLVMVFGLFGVASASSFTDDSTIQYKEAVDVMTGIGAINGLGNGTFAPKGNLTRAQAAKMVAYAVLGADIAKVLPVSASSFKDVDVANFSWAIPSIEYLVKKGVINGVGDGKFEPNGNVTGYQIAKMLLVALEVKGEFTGSSWELNTAIAANKAGIVTGSKATSFSAAATREEAALYCFNALLYSPTSSSGDKIYGITGWDTTTTPGTAIPIYGWVTVPTVTTGSLASTVYGLTNAVASDDFGRPSVRAWTYKTKVISLQQTVVPTLTYSNGATYAKLFTDLKLTANKTATTFTDGKFNTATITIDYADNTTKIGGNGALTEVYVDANTGAITIVTVNSYIGTVTAVTAATAVAKATVTVTPKAVKLGAIGANTFEATGHKANDVVLYTAAQTGAATWVIKSVAAATSKTLQATSYVANTSFVAGGTTYTYSAKNNGTPIGDFAAHDVYFDANGYVIDVTGATVAANYAVVIAAGTTSDGLGGTSNNVKLLKTDGTSEVIKGAADYTALIGNVVTYSLSATTGLYTLVNPASTDYAQDGNVALDTLALSLKTGVPAFVWTADDATAPAAGTATTFYANASTIFLVRSGSVGAYTYTAYKGIAAVPSISGAAVGQVVVNAVTNFADVVYITNGTSGTTASGTVYLTGTYSTTVDATKGTYYTSNAVVNGEIKTIDLGVAPVKGLYTGVTYNALGVGTIDAPATVATATGVKATANGVIGLGAGYFSYAPTCAVYYVSTVAGTSILTGVGSVSSIAGLITDTTDTVTYTVSTTTGQVTAIYVEVVAGA